MRKLNYRERLVETAVSFVDSTSFARSSGSSKSPFENTKKTLGTCLYLALLLANDLGMNWPAGSFVPSFNIDLLFKLQIFVANDDRASVVFHEMYAPVVATMLRVKPLVWNKRIALRLEIHGCGFHY